MEQSVYAKRRRIGPRSLVVVAAVCILAGDLGLYFYQGSRANLLYFFFLPVAAVSVVLGWRTGVLLALFAVVAVLFPTYLLGLNYLVPSSQVSTGEKYATVAIWAIFLIAMAWLVGWVSERGGSLTLTRGFGDRTVRVLERERLRTGQDIHDGISQYAAAAYMETQILSSLAEGSATDGVAPQAERVRHLVDALAKEARSMVGHMRPPALGPEQFTPTFSQLIEDFRKRSGIACDLEVEGDLSLHSDAMRICIYRTTQEALSNAEQHSGATKVRVWIRAAKRGVDVLIHDDGRGLPPDVAPDGRAKTAGDNGHYGLQGMHDRVECLGGRLTLRSSPGAGTTVSAHVPAYRREKDRIDERSGTGRLR